MSIVNFGTIGKFRAQAVLRVRFQEGAGEEQIEMEEANESEIIGIQNDRMQN